MLDAICIKLLFDWYLLVFPFAGIIMPSEVNFTSWFTLFNIKELKYSLRDSNIIFQPKFEKVTYGKNTFKYYGAHIWNLLPSEIKETADI